MTFNMTLPKRYMNNRKMPKQYERRNAWTGYFGDHWKAGNMGSVWDSNWKADAYFAAAYSGGTPWYAPSKDWAEEEWNSSDPLQNSEPSVKYARWSGSSDHLEESSKQ